MKKSFNLVIHPVFILLGILMAFTGEFFLFISYFITICLHELGHYVVASRLGYHLNNFCLLPQGAMLSYSQQFFSYSDEVKIAMAGPLVNVAITIFIVALWWIVPLSYPLTETFAFCNITTALFNFLPILPLDGGRCVLAFFAKRHKRKLAKNICMVFGITFCLILLCFFVYSFYIKINFTFLIIAIFLLIGIFSPANKSVYVNAFSKEVKKQSATKGIKVSTYVIDENAPLSRLIPLVSGHNYNMIYISNEYLEIVASLHESDIEKLLERYEVNCKIKDVI